MSKKKHTHTRSRSEGGGARQDGELALGNMKQETLSRKRRAPWRTPKHRKTVFEGPLRGTKKKKSMPAKNENMVTKWNILISNESTGQ